LLVAKDGGRRVAKKTTPALRNRDRDIDPNVQAVVTQTQESGKTRRFIAGAVSAPLTVAATGLPAWVIAGTTTNFNVTFALTFGLAATVAGVPGWAWGAWKHKKATDARRRVGELEGQTSVLIEARNAAQSRAEDLESDVRRYREDVDRLQAELGQRKGRER
jgi:hypothetical protein